MEDKEVKHLVNEVFQKKGHPKVKNFAAEFADGSKWLKALDRYRWNVYLRFVYVELFQTFFNILYEEKIDCKLVTSALVDDRMLNWNRINAVICFNYLQ